MNTPLPATLTDARTMLDGVNRAIADGAPGVDELREVVEGIHGLAGALTELVDTLMTVTPSVLDDGNRAVGGELLRDLRAARGCFTTAGLLVAPAVDDLRKVNALGNGHGDAEPQPPEPRPQLSAVDVIDRAARTAL